MYNANQKFCNGVNKEIGYDKLFLVQLTTNQLVADVIEVPRPRIFIAKISGGYTHATQAQVNANDIT